MENPRLNPKNKRALIGGVIIALIAGFLLLRPFITVILVSCIAAYTFYPIYRVVEKKSKKAGLAATVTLLASILAVVIPVLITVFITIAQLKTFSNDVTRLVENVDFATLQGDIINQVNAFLSRIPFVNANLSSESISQNLTSIASNVSSWLLNQLSSYAGGLSRLLTNAILFMYVFLAVLIHQKSLIRTFRRLNPLGDDVSKIYLQQASSMTNGMVRGQFVIAIAQGIVSAATLAIAGIDYFAFFALILTVFSIIPLGGGIITIPIGIVMLLTGNIWQGLFVILGHLLLVTNIDNVLRPHLVPKDAKLDPALTILGVFGGLSAFGLLGVVVGPVLMILIVTTIKIYTSSSSTT